MSVKLKLLRLQSGMTLDQVAQMSGLTKSYVSKVERGASMPSIASALRLAKALDVPVEDLFGTESDDDAPVHVARAQAQRDLGSGVPLLISGRLPQQKLTAFVLRPADVAVASKPRLNHDGEEILYVVEGQVEIDMAGKTEVLNPGDSVHFDSRIPHVLRSSGTTAAKVLVVIA